MRHSLRKREVVPQVLSLYKLTLSTKTAELDDFVSVTSVFSSLLRVKSALDMCTSIKSSLSKDGAMALLAHDVVPPWGNPANTLQTLKPDDVLYGAVENMLDERLAVHTAHSFHLNKLEVVSASASLSRVFKRRLQSCANIRFLFHGTTETNHDSIFNSGFLIDEEHFGDTDKGYIGKGVYFSPNPEYSASYIRKTAGVTRFQYACPVDQGCTFKLLGCIVIVGNTLRKTEKEYGSTIPAYLDSHWAWIEKTEGSVANNPEEHFAQEFAIRDPQGCYPRFKLSLTRVQREIIWIDPNIANSENSGYVKKLKKVCSVFLYATSNKANALQALKKQKEGTAYRAITAGSGGEDFVQALRSSGIYCPIMVFCHSVDYHKTWAKKFYNVKVTSATEMMMKFVKWEE